MQKLHRTGFFDANLGFAEGGGELGAVLRSMDWAGTPLGPLETWPPSLRTAAGMMLNARHPMYIAWGPELCLLYNDSYGEILGAKAADPRLVLGKPFREVWADIWDQVGPMLAATLQGESLWFEDSPFTLVRNGFPEQMYASFSTSPVRDESGSIAGVMCVCSETTGKVRSEQERDRALGELARREESAHSMAQEALALAQANAKFQTFFEQGMHFAGLAALDGTLLEVNRIAAEGCGFDRAEMIGRPFCEGGWWRPSAALSGQIRDAVEGARQGRTFRAELPYFVADGSRRFADLVIAPVSDEQGRLLFIASTGIDITERRQVEERLRLLDAIGEATRLAAEPKAIMEHSTRLLGEYLGATRVAYADLEPDNDRFTIRHDWRVEGAISTVGVYSLDLFGSLATSNLRVGRTLLINDVDAELAHGDGFEMFNSIGIKAIICCPLVKQNRLVAMMAVHQQAPRTWSEEEVALVEAVVDRCWAHIERVRSTEALREADRRKSAFLATLAHELRNPLAPIRNALELLRIGADKPGLMDRVRVTMERQVGHMVHLINDLLDIARISSGKVVLQIERVDLQTVVDSAVETSLPLIQSAGHALALRLPEAPLWLDVDAVRLSQVLSNLLSNAAKYTPQGGSIAVSAQAEGGMAVIQVLDTGIGIAPDALEAVFDMFAQAPHSVGISKGGLGIGLSLVRHLVALHGGSVTASSPGPGQGSTFTVRLPLAAAPALDAGADVGSGAQAGAEASSSGALRVLVADDNVDAADTLAYLLRLAGHEVRVAYDGEEALRIGGEFMPALAFLDIGMPRMDGYQTAQALRALPGMHGVRLVALTGWGADDDRARSHAAGFDHHLLKPAFPEQVQAILASVPDWRPKV
jgi:PAS domain S-box-containing protein